MSQNSPKLPSISVVLHNIRSIYNVGAILRTCEGFGVEQAIFSGYTPRYNDPALLPHLREKLNHQIAKSALGAEQFVPQLHIDDAPRPGDPQASTSNLQSSINSSQASIGSAQALVSNLTEWLAAQRQNGYLIIGLENNLAPEELSRRWVLGTPLQCQAGNNAGPQSGMNPQSNTDTQHSAQTPRQPAADFSKLVLVLGEEVGGIPAAIRPQLDLFLEIPMYGRKESFNVSVATGIALYGLRQLAQG